MRPSGAKRQGGRGRAGPRGVHTPDADLLRGGPPRKLRCPRLAQAALAVLALTLAARQSHGDSVIRVMTAKRITAETVAVIDPESGTSQGGGNTNVNVGPGDIISFRFEFTPDPEAGLRSTQTYLTEYVPPNTEVVGVRVLTPDGLTAPVRPPSQTALGWGGGGPQGFAALWGLEEGSLAQLYCDSGVFFSTDPRTARVPDNAFITVFNGIEMNPPPGEAGAMAAALGIPGGGPFYTHNEWDWIQVMGFGSAGDVGPPVGGDIIPAGRGNTPHLYGSPVAGPDTWYGFEATRDGVNPDLIEPRGVVGPWQRIRYPGSTTCTGTAATEWGADGRVAVPTTAGWNLNLTNPLPPGTNAVRFALGDTAVGMPLFGEITLRVLDTPLDPNQGADVNCAEVFGSDSSAPQGNDDNPWQYHLPSPACVYLGLLFELAPDKLLALPGDTVVYTIHGKNLKTTTETNVVVTDRFEPARMSFVSATGGAVLAGDTLTWPTMDLVPSAEFTFTATFTVLASGADSTINTATYTSDQLPAPGFQVRALVNITAVAVITVSMTAVPDEVLAGDTVTYTVVVRNDTGTADGSTDFLQVVLPSGFTVNPGTSQINGAPAADPAGGPPTYQWVTNTPVPPGGSLTLTFDVTVDSAVPDGLYPSNVSWVGLTGGFQTEVFESGVAPVAVGLVRSDAPVLDEPIMAGDVCVSGTTTEADGTVIEVFVNGLPAGTTIANGGTFSLCGLPPFYAGQDVTATATAPGELVSPPSTPVIVQGAGATVCTDGLDNDGDTLIDFPADPGCSSPADNSEDDPPPPECSDGLDNDSDTFVDFPADLSCSDPYDNTESGPPACSDATDNDGDALVDFPADPGCTGPNDPNEVDFAACQDGADNDGDALADFPDDPGCHSAFDNDETDFTFPTDPIKARLLVVFDTSGSMNWNTCAPVFTGGDGSTECPGNDVTCAECSSSSCSNGLADDSRIYKVKRGISDAVTAYGSVDWGLMRFYQRAVPFGCPIENASLASGGWQGAGAAPCGGGFNAGEVLVGFSPDNVSDLLAWTDLQANYPGIPPAGMDRELRGSGTTPLAGSLNSALAYLAAVRAADSQAACRPYRVILVTDGQETCGGDPVAAAASLDASGIPVHVVGFATTDATIVAGLNAIAAAGGTTGAVFSDDEVALSTAIASIVTASILVETCNGLDDDCDGLIDEDFADLGAPCDNGMMGACLRPGTMVCRADGLGTECNAPAGTPSPEICNLIDDDCNGFIDDGIVPPCPVCSPSPEICNGVDDDCDSVTDEPPLPGVGDPCGLDIGECMPGTLQCLAGVMDCIGAMGPTAEVCNNLDDDCDGITDGFMEECYTFPTGCIVGIGCDGECRTGLRTCTAGMFGPCVGESGPAVELCNGLDDDCDGSTDEDWPELGTACDNGMPPTCLTTGVYACLPDGSGTFCTAAPVLITQEVCNGSDDDCDGQIDEDPLPPPVGDPCGSTGPGCTPGTLQCVLGVIQCVGATGGGTEMCNGADDDCDGLIDEPPLPDVGDPCTDPGFENIGDTGECEFGQTECVDATIVCVGYVGPVPETCNGLDDDCDGEADNEAECPDPEDLCFQGTCVSKCPETEFPCAFGFVCESLPEGDYCLPDPCQDVTCPPGLLPDPDGVAGTCECIDPCENVTCLPGQVCEVGVCKDCFDPGHECVEGEICVENQDGAGECVPDPCVAAGCDPANEYCTDGMCCPLRCSPACGGGEFCDTSGCAAICGPDLCEGVECSEGQLCRPDDGECVFDRCNGVWCPVSHACHPATGACIPDPCAAVECRENEACRLTEEGHPECVVLSQPPGVDVLGTGSGGCSTCRAGRGTRPTGPATPLSMLALFGLVVGLRRRRSGRACEQRAWTQRPGD